MWIFDCAKLSKFTLKIVFPALFVDKQKALPISHSLLLELKDKIEGLSDVLINVCSVDAVVLEKKTASHSRVLNSLE